MGEGISWRGRGGSELMWGKVERDKLEREEGEEGEEGVRRCGTKWKLKIGRRWNVGEGGK